VLRVGLCPEALVAPALPTEPHDVPMHFVVTERRVIAGAPAAR
jgi:5-formyltetrahydrofolate cyclo-ligase